MRRISFAVFTLLLVLTLNFSVNETAPVQAQDTNLVRNPGFEGNYNAWLPQFGTAQMADEWTPWWVNDADHDPEWAMPEYKRADGRSFPDRVVEGDAAQQWFNFHRSSYAGIYQQIPNVTPGQTYRFSIYGQVWSSSSDEPRPSKNPGDPNFRIGIDPTGAAVPGPVSDSPSTVVWSNIAPMDQIIDKYYQMSIDVTAESDTITIYVNASPQWPLKHNDIYVDAANVIAVGTPAPAPTTPPASGGGGDCVIPASGPWPPCATGGGGGAAPGDPGCVIPASGPWPPCATGGSGGGTPVAGNPGCVIPPSGPWPPCATDGSGGGTPVAGKPGCVIPASGPWPPCATEGGGGDPAAPANPSPPAATPTPAPSAPATGNAGAFKMGGQTHTLANPDLMLNTGLEWVKFQHKWGSGQNPQDLQGRISDAKARGFKVLMSMPGAPYPTEIDFAGYTEFLRGVASLNPAPDAIEVWNEMNIDFEWPLGEISGASYVNNMLKPGYQAIKAANPNVMVISGALAPTGFFGGGCTANGCDDEPYIREMVAAGAMDYMDCLGVHYNEGIISPHLREGDPRGNSGHYTRYYWGMVDAYWNASGGRKPLCFTELGYVSGEGYGELPPGFSWASETSIAEHAQWLGEATQLSKDSSKVEMLIIFNVDFTLFSGNDPQAGYAMIRKDGSCPACDTVRSALGR